MQPGVMLFSYKLIIFMYINDISNEFGSYACKCISTDCSVFYDKMRNFYARHSTQLSRAYLVFGMFPNEGYADPPPLRNDHFCMKDAQYTETNEKSYFRILVF